MNWLFLEHSQFKHASIFWPGAIFPLYYFTHTLFLLCYEVSILSDWSTVNTEEDEPIISSADKLFPLFFGLHGLAGKNTRNKYFRMISTRVGAEYFL